MMKRLYILMILMVATVGLKAQTIQEQMFEKANFYYNESRYDTALVIYNSIIDEGYVSAPLLYNIGNSYFKMRNYPMAILNYEKALKLEPNNDEIKQNLAIANALITDKIEPVPVFFTTKLWKALGNKLSADGWAIATLILFGLLMLSLFFYFTARSKGMKKTSFFTSVILVLLCVCSIILAIQKYRYLRSRNEGIVITTTITVKSSPSQSGVDLFVLHEGTKVEIMDRADNWDKIKIADGSVGWLPSNTTIKY